MNYAELCVNIQEICENEFSPDQLAMFTQQAEQKIYNTVQLPAIRKTVTTPGALTVGNDLFTLPPDFLFAYSFAVIDTAGRYHFLLNKDVNFIREAYPVNDVATRGLPKYYALEEPYSVILGPTPEVAYGIQLNYAHYPESIVTAGTTWLGDNFDSALLNGALIEAIRFMKGEQDMIAVYEKLYVQAIGLLKQLGDGKLREDAYRSGQVRIPVS
jgi:hypothetical protein